MKNLKTFETYSSDAYSTDDWAIIDYDNDSGKILSVKRISDGEVFSIGDEIGLRPDNKSAGKIDRLWKSFDQMRIDVGSLGLVLNDELVNLKKVTENIDSEDNVEELLSAAKLLNSNINMPEVINYLNEKDFDYYGMTDL